MSRFIRTLTLLLTLALVAAACGSTATTDSAAAEPETEEEVEAEAEPEPEVEAEAEAEGEPADVDLADMTWDEVLAQAQVEGEINWSHWYLQERIRPFVAAFTDETGIVVNVSDGDFQANEDKLLAESDRETGSTDVMSYTFGAMSNVDIDAFFASLDQLPDIGNLTTVLEGVDTNGRGIAWWGNQTGIAYDATRIDEADLPQTFEELQTWIAENPNGFGVNDPSMGGAGHSFVQSTLRNLSGSDDFFDDELDEAKVESWEPAWEWLETAVDDMVITGNNADTLTRINDGEIIIGPAWEDQLAGLQLEGEISENVAIYLPDFGMNGGSNSITIPANAENPAAALVFIDWITSPEVQAQLNAEFGVAPQHPDAPATAALISADQRVNTRRWFTAAYGDLVVPTFVERILGA